MQTVQKFILGTVIGVASQILLSPHSVSAETSFAPGPTKHFVAFKYKSSTTTEQKTSMEKAFIALKQKIPQIASLECGANTSTEKLDKGMTYGFLLTFKTAKDRDKYLIHPAHVLFKENALPLVEDVFVFDFQSAEQTK